MNADNTRPPWLEQVRSWSGPVLGGGALIVAFWGLTTAQRTERRLVALETRVVAVAKAMASASARGKGAKTTPPPAQRDRLRRPGKAKRRKAPSRPSAAEGGAPNPLDRQKKIRQEVTALVSEFGAQHRLDEETMKKVLGELEARRDALRVVFQDLTAGTLTAEEAREEVMWVRDDSTEVLQDLLGDELLAELEERLAERSPRRKRAAANRGVSDGLLPE